MLTEISGILYRSLSHNRLKSGACSISDGKPTHGVLRGPAHKENFMSFRSGDSVRAAFSPLTQEAQL